MKTDRSLLTRALGALRERAVAGGEGFVITDPWAVLDHMGLPRACIADLVQTRCLESVPTQRGRYRIKRETLPSDGPLSEAPITPGEPVVAAPTVPAPTPPVATGPTRAPRFLLVLDAENVFLTHEKAGIPFDPAAIRDAAAAVGPIAFAFAYGNIEKIPPRTREDLTIAGFPLMHCQRLRDGNGGKDTVDENAQDLIGRFVAYDAVDGVILVTDDRNFAPIMRGVLDAGKRMVRFTLRGETMLDALGEVHQLHRPEPGNGRRTATDRRWSPDLVIEEFRRLPSLPTEEQGPTLRRIQLHAPLVQRFLRALLRRLWGRLGSERTMHFPPLVAFAETTVREEDRKDISRDDLRAFCSMLNEIGILRTFMFEREDGGERRAYRPDWDHPFCADAIADIRDQPRNWSRGRRPNNTVAVPGSQPRAKVRFAASADGTTYRIVGAHTRDDALAAAARHCEANGVAPETIASLRAIGSAPHGTSLIELRAEAPGMVPSANGDRDTT